MAPADNTELLTTGAPLAGRSVLVTRTREQAQALVAPLEAYGAEVLLFPVIEVADPEDIAPLDLAARKAPDYSWIVLTSTNGVDRFFRRLADAQHGPDALANVRLAAVGRATAERMREYGVEPHFVPADFRAEGLLEGFREMGVGEGDRILIPRALEAREILPEQLREMGADVDVVVTYRLTPAEPERATLRRLEDGSIDVLTLGSGGTFKHFLATLERSGLDPRKVTESLDIASVGPVTSEAVRSLGFDVAVEAPESTMESLAAAIARHYASGSAR